MLPDGFNIHYNSPDFDTNLRYYRDVLGLTIKSQFSHERRRGVIFAVGEGAELEFFGPPHGIIGEDCPSFVNLRIKLTVPDVEAEYQRLIAHAVDVMEHLEMKPWGEYAFTVQAPDGLTITIAQVM